MECQLLLMFVLAFIPTILARNATVGTIVVDGVITVAETDENFICLTIDIWPHDECTWRQLCIWDGNASVLNVNLSLPILNNAVQAFKSLRIRVGGTLQDRLIYDVGSFKGEYCPSFESNKSSLFEFSEGCLHMERWDALNHFFNKTGAIVTFGLNALLGRRHNTRSGGIQWEGDWNYTNAEALIQYTVDNNYHINSWELGNELAGSHSIGASVAAPQYAKDLIKLREIIDRLYNNSQQEKPLIVAPGGFFDGTWYDDLMNGAGSGVVNALTHHIYNMGAGNDPKLIYRFVNPTYLSQVSNVFQQLESIIERHGSGTGTAAWVGEAGGAYHGGSPHISDAFINSFWYLDQLGMASLYNTKVYCRQTLIGGHYGVLKPKTLVPTPDYYGALLFHRLMGPGVLNIDNNVSSYLRSYAHCSRGRSGVTLLFINLSNKTDFIIKVENHINMTNLHRTNSNGNNFSLKFNRKGGASKGGSTSTLDSPSQREEYHLTPKNGLLRSSSVLLNGNPLEISQEEELPNLTPIYRESNSSINIATWSVAFVVIPDFVAPACT